jgi:hypothetical protein
VLVIVLRSGCGCETYHGEDVVWVLEGAVMKDGGVSREGKDGGWMVGWEWEMRVLGSY